MQQAVARPAADPASLPGQLARSVRALIGEQAAGQADFGIAVSGGPDSLALLLLMHQAFPGQIRAATVDHRLRAESAEEARAVGHICATHGIVHDILTPEAAITGSLQANARRARYALLAAWRAAHDLDWVMTAHHADDQLETLVMRLNRSSGVGGLAGIRAQQGHILRPLLHMRRAALAAWLAEQHIAAADDPSNRDDRFDRARIRKALAGQTLLDVDAVAASMAQLADAEAAIAWSLAQLLPARLTRASEGLCVDLAALPHELQRRLLLTALQQLAPDRPAPRGEALTRAMAALAQQRQSMLGDILLRPDAARNGLIHLQPAPARR